MTKLTGETLNIEEKNIIKIKELFPEIDTDGKIDFDKLKQLLGDYVEDSDERYNFTWNGKGEALRISQTPSMGTLRPAPEESKNWDETENLYIEGDNLEVLKLLQKSYFNKVDVIYIDPPYNTGGDFVYKDNFKDNIKNYKELTGQIDSEGQHTTTNREYSGRYHTDWLNMMYPRLKLARNLLTDDGVIFISIDDNEVHNLRKIGDEIFGEDNFLAQFVWERSQHYGRQKLNTYNNHDYIISYAKRKFSNGLKKILVENTITDLEDAPLYNGSNPVNILEFPKSSVKFNINDGVYTESSDEKYILLDHVTVKNGINKNSFRLKFKSRWSPKKILEEHEKGTTYWVKSENFAIRAIYHDEKSFNSAVRNIIFTNKSNNNVSRNNYGIIPGTSDEGSNEVADFFGSQVFSYPKPTSLIAYILGLLYSEKSQEYLNDFTVLDFFAGSSTTAQATMELNSLDNGNRKFIMVQLPEETDKKSEAYKSGYENIAEIGKERIRRAGEQIKDVLTEKYELASDEERKEMKHPDELDIGFKTFKLDSSNIKEWNPGQYDDVQLAIEDSLTPYVEGRTEEDVVYEMILKMGLDLTYPVEEYEVNGKTIYSVGYGFLMISLADEINLAIAEKMIEIKEDYQPKEFRVIFRDEGFRNDTDKTNIKETLRSAGLAEEAFITL